MSNEFERKKHSVSIENRESIELTGVKDVPSFDEDDVTICTDLGEISLKGSSLKIEALDLDTGNVKICGKITALIYNEKQNVKGIFKRGLFSQ